LVSIKLNKNGLSSPAPGTVAGEAWTQQMVRNATEEGWGYLNQRRYALHDRETKFCESFRTILAAGGIKAIVLPARSPNLNAYAERLACYPPHR